MFSDLSGYTAMNERLDPEEVTGIMVRFKEAAERIVEGHGGMVNQFVGDEVFALFGIPTAHEDDPARAVRAGLELHEAARVLGEELQVQLGETLRLHSGIDTGLVVASADGGDERGGRYVVTGDTVNTAARLAAQAEMDDILVSPDTRRLITHYFDLEALEPVAFKGKATPMVPYRVVGMSGVQSRFEASEAAGFTHFTGREIELELLQTALSKTLSGQGQVVTISGEAGMGKSRLAYEFRHGIDRNQCILVEGRCQSYGTSTPYLPFLDSLRRGLRLEEADSPEALRKKVGDNVRAISTDLEKFLPHYLHLLSIPSKEHPLPVGLEGEALRRELEEALAAIITKNTHHKPMVMLLEDWHWADEASNAALNRLVSLSSDFPLLLVILHRMEFTADFGSLSHHEAISLPVLSVDHTGNIARSVFGAEILPDGLAKVLHEKTGGNPYFTEEVCHALSEEDICWVEDGCLHLRRSLDQLHVPDTVDAVIRSRVDRLNKQSQEALRLASIIGREFGRRLLEAVAEGRVNLGGVLERLSAQELIRQVRLQPEAAYRFKHALMQSVVYETILIQQRKALHSIVAQALEALYPDRLEEHYETLAHHYSQSDDTEKAIEFLEKAGDKAARYYSLEDSRRYYRSVIKLLESAVQHDDVKQRFLDVVLKLAEVSLYAPSPEYLTLLETSKSYAQEFGDENRMGLATYWIGRMHSALGNLSQARPFFEQCIQMAEVLKDDELLGLPYCILGRMCYYSAEFKKGIEYLDKGIPVMRKLDHLEEVIYASSFQAMLYVFIGDYATGHELVTQAIEDAREINSATCESAALAALSFIYNRKGLWKASQDAADRCAQISKEIGNPVTEGIGKSFLGYATFMSGRPVEGIGLMKEGISTIEAAGSKLSISLLYNLLAEIAALSGATEEAIEYSRKALEGSRNGDHLCEECMHLANAIISSYGPNPNREKIINHMESGKQSAMGRESLPNLAVFCFHYAEILHKIEDSEQAQEQLEEAATLFGEMEMTWWLEQAEALRGRLKRGEHFKGFTPYTE